MPALVFTASSATDQLAITAHGLLTGAGPVLAFAAGGTLPTASGGDIVEGTQYWAIRIDADHVKLARSNALALAGTAIDLTSNGSGQQYLLVGLPFCRARTYANGVQIPPEDLNALQDDDTGAKHGIIRRNIPLTPTFIDSTSTWAQTGDGIKSTSVAAPTVVGSYIDCPFDVGDKILGLEVWRKSDGTGSSKGCTLTLAAAGSLIIAIVSPDTIASGATTRAMLVVPSSTDVGHVMAAGEKLQFVFFGTGSTGYIIDCAQLVVMRP